MRSEADKMVDEVPKRSISWTRSCRLIPSRFPPVELYEPVADPKDWEALKAIESITNPRLVPDGAGHEFLRPEDRNVTQPWLTAPFAYPDTQPSLFSDGSYGVCLVAQTNEGALIEAVRRREAFLRATATPPTKLDMRLLIKPVSAQLHDLSMWGSLGDPVETRRLCCALQAAGSHGVVLPSGFRQGEQTAVLFRPTAMTSATQSTHYCFIWDGKRIAGIYAYAGQSDDIVDPDSLITRPAKAAA